MPERGFDRLQLERIVSHRRALHRIPEGANHEFKTKEYILACLKELKPDQLDFFGETGLRAIFLCKNKNAKTIGLRSDMDALPIAEKTGLPFASQHEGYMHACGHDGHMALLLTFLEFAAANRGRLGCHIAAIFQPAEENQLGAKDMVDAGILENPRVDEVYGFHLMPIYKKNEIALSPGAVMAGNTSFTVRISGKGAHGATPHLGSDQILAAAHAITMIQSRMTRLSQAEPSVLSFGQIRGGNVPNALPESVEFTGVCRYFSRERRAQILALIDEAAQAAAQGFSAKAELIIGEKEYPPVINHALVVERALPLLANPIPAPAQMIAEDFSCYLHERPGMYGFIGTGDETHQSPLHSDTFDFDEAALLPALEFYKQLSLQGGSSWPVS